MEAEGRRRVADRARGDLKNLLAVLRGSAVPEIPFVSLEKAWTWGQRAAGFN